MQRDMDLIRELLLKLEAYPMSPGSIVYFEPGADELQVEGYDANQIEYHLDLIGEADLIDMGGSRPMTGFTYRRLTWAGHEFLDSIRSPEVWSKTKNGAEAAGGFTVDLLKDIAKGFIRKQVEDYTGVKL